MPKKPEVNPDELAAFEEAMKGAKLHIHNKVRLAPKEAKTPARKEPSLFHEDHDLNSYLPIAPVSNEEFISYKQSSIPNKTLRKLRQGQYNIEATLDLHGMTIEQAEKATLTFLLDCTKLNIRVALIIHGKGKHSGKPVLKNCLNQWLRNISTVLAFCSAKVKHGCRGAVYVLIKRFDEEKYS